MNFEPGELVKWFENYHDGDIVKDVGLGIILSSSKVSYENLHHISYEIYRNKHNDKMFFHEQDITKLRLKGE